MMRRSGERGVMTHSGSCRRRYRRCGSEAVGAGAGLRSRTMRLSESVKMGGCGVMRRVEGKTVMRKGGIRSHGQSV